MLSGECLAKEKKNKKVVVKTCYQHKTNRTVHSFSITKKHDE